MKLSFSSYHNRANARLATANLKISVNPVEAIFQDVVLLPGSTIQGKGAINVLNMGDVNLRYWIFADWAPIPPTTSLEALLAAGLTQALITKPVFPPLTVFSGSLQQLRDKPPGGRFLAPQAAEDLLFTLMLPPLPDVPALDARLKIDFLFVGVSINY